MSEESKIFKPFYLRNWLSLAGVIVAIGSFFAFALLFVLDFLASKENPYLGILTFLVAPFFLLLGISMIGLGWALHRRQSRIHQSDGKTPVLTIDLTRHRDRLILSLFTFGAVAFLLVTAVGSYQTYHVTESNQFCMQTCHTPMEPEAVAYSFTPHAQVECTSCHVGPGASGFMKAKINGLRQVYLVAFNNFDRPIQACGRTAVNRESCTQCHWPEKYVGEVDKHYTYYLPDETNTPFQVHMKLKVGGGDSIHGPTSGIHWHMSLANKVEYIATDPLKQTIPWVRMTDKNGVVTEYRTADFKEDIKKHEVHTMECIDCHSRPAHRIPTPFESVDLALSLGRIDASLPNIKKEAVAALTQSYKNREEAVAQIQSSLSSKYQGKPKLEDAIHEVQAIYSRSFFPEMNTNWRTNPNNLGHTDWPGCFRCHDGAHASQDGAKTISGNDCNQCHTIIAQGNASQIKEVHLEGLPFAHPGPELGELLCSDCHQGKLQE